MLHLRVYGRADSLTEIGAALEDLGAARNVALAQGIRSGHVLLTAEVFADSVDAVLELLVHSGVAEEDIKLARFDEIGPIKVGAYRREPDLGRHARAGQGKRPAGRARSRLYDRGGWYRGLWRDRGERNLDRRCDGGMAGSPDLLPITPTCVGLVGRRYRLV